MSIREVRHGRMTALPAGTVAKSAASSPSGSAGLPPALSGGQVTEAHADPEPANAAPAGPAKAASGSGSRSKKPPSPRPAPRTPTSPNTNDCAPGSDTAARSAPSNTRCSSPTGTCSPPARPTENSAATTTNAATPNAPPNASSPDFKNSVTPSPSNQRRLDPERIPIRSGRPLEGKNRGRHFVSRTPSPDPIAF